VGAAAGARGGQVGPAGQPCSYSPAGIDSHDRRAEPGTTAALNERCRRRRRYGLVRRGHASARTFRSHSSAVPAQEILRGMYSGWRAAGLGRRRARVQIAAATLSRNSLRRQTAHTHRASVHQRVKLVAALSRVARITAGLAESNGSLPPGLRLTHLQADCQEPGSAPEPCALQSSMGYLYLFTLDNTETSL